MLHKSTDKHAVNFVNICGLYTKEIPFLKSAGKQKGYKTMRGNTDQNMAYCVELLHLSKSTSTSILLNGNMLQILSTGYDKLIKLNE